MTAESTLTVRRATSSDRAAVLELLAGALGWDDVGELDGFFAWKHEQNPFGPSPAWVAMDGTRIAGFRTFLRWEFIDGSGTIRRAVRAVDTATHADYRGRGVFRALTLAAVDELTDDGVEFVFNTPNDQSRPGYLTMGWQTVGRLPAAVRMRGMTGALRMLRARVPAERWPLAGGGGETASDLLRHPSVTALLERLPASTGLCTRRSVAYLQWRYGYAPLGYRAIAVGDDPARGLAIFRVRRRGDAREAALCEVLTPAGSAAAVKQLCGSVARASGADYAIRLGARGAGFVPLPRQGPILTWRSLATRDKVAPAASRWQLSLGDVELL